MSKKLRWPVALMASALAITWSHQVAQHSLTRPTTAHPLKVYWFIPDGLRADRDQFNIYEWARKGELPHLRTLMSNGSYGYSWPVFPGHTPTNFATLMTGTDPVVHGIADGPMRMTGYPLNMVAKGGFSSFAKLVPPLWVIAEKAHNLVTVQSIPGSTPPELTEGYTIKGRWGGWGLDFPAVIFQDSQSDELAVELGQNKRLFTFGSDLTKFLKAKPATGWKNPPASLAPAMEIRLENWGNTLFAYLYSTKDQNKYDRVLFSFDKMEILADLSADQWSGWLPIHLNYELKNDYNKYTPKKTGIERSLSEVEIDTQFKIKVIRLGTAGEFRIRFVYDTLNEFLTSPAELSEPMHEKIGPMIDFVDNYPPQLIYFHEDKKTFLEESEMSFDWHQKAVPFLINDLKSEIVIHSTYNPNQMLTSRWWMPYLDRQSTRYNEVSEKERQQLWKEVKAMYRRVDDILGEIMKNADENTYIVFSSDHGNIPLNKEVRLNNLFAEKGWLKYNFNSESKEYEIDWKNSKVIFLQMNSIYINPNGLDGSYRRQNSKSYYELRDAVIAELKKLKDPETGLKPLAQIWSWENAEKAGLPKDRVGDLVIANAAGMNWVEDISADHQIFKGSLKGGYKQAIWPKGVEGMLTPFVIVGPGIKAGYQIPEPINHVDQFSVIMKALKLPLPSYARGRDLKEIWDHQP